MGSLFPCPGIDVGEGYGDTDYYTCVLFPVRPHFFIIPCSSRPASVRLRPAWAAGYGVKRPFLNRRMGWAAGRLGMGL